MWKSKKLEGWRKAEFQKQILIHIMDSLRSRDLTKRWKLDFFLFRFKRARKVDDNENCKNAKICANLLCCKWYKYCSIFCNFFGDKMRLHTGKYIWWFLYIDVGNIGEEKKLHDKHVWEKEKGKKFFSNNQTKWTFDANNRHTRKNRIRR